RVCPAAPSAPRAAPWRAHHRAGRPTAATAGPALRRPGAAAPGALAGLLVLRPDPDLQLALRRHGPHPDPPPAKVAGPAGSRGGRSAGGERASDFRDPGPAPRSLSHRDDRPRGARPGAPRGD